MRLYLIRHGQTPYNEKRIMQGHSEVPLSDLGIAQAARLGARLAGEGIEQIYASDLRRATMTACVVASHTGAPLSYDEGFRERNPGDLTHRSYEESEGFFTDRDYFPPNGEGAEEFDARVRGAFETLVEREGDRSRRIAVVSHGMVCASFVRQYLGRPAEGEAPIGWHNTSLSILEYAGEWETVVLNDGSHIEGLAAATAADGENATGG